MMKPKAPSTLLVVLTLILLPTLSNAALYTDTDAIMPGHAELKIDDTTIGWLDYAIFAQDDYDGSIAFPGKNFVYCYQVFNTAPSDIAVDFFSVGLFPGVDVANPLADPFCASGVPGGISPSAQFILSQTVLYIFQCNPVMPGEHSSVLLFASDSGPQMGSGVVDTGSAGGITIDLPTPTPEPTSLLLFTIATPVLMRLRRRNH